MTNLLPRVCFAAVFATCLAGCGDYAAEGEEATAVDEAPIDRLERDLGPDGVMELMRSGNKDEIESLLRHYEIGYHVDTRLITDCPKNFPSSDRNAWHSVGGEQYYIDGSGRPSRALANLPPIAAEARNTTCQTSVGQWGDAETPSNDYDGGHLIGSQLGGYGKRANLVPQDANFNRGNWAVLENKMADCAGLPNGRFEYYITVGYSNSTKLVPSSFGMRLTNRSSGSGVSLSFSNTDSGGSSGVSEKNRGVTFLTNNGC